MAVTSRVELSRLLAFCLQGATQAGAIAAHIHTDTLTYIHTHTLEYSEYFAYKSFSFVVPGRNALMKYFVLFNALAT